MENPLISIIVPIYKVEDYLDECIESIISQTYRNLEIILVDDGSPDSCPQKCDEWAARDSRIKVIHKKNEGLSSARNAGLEIATGDFIGYVDSDDYIDKRMYEKLLAAFEGREDIGITCCMVMAFDSKKTYPYSTKWIIGEPQLTSSDNFFLDILKSRICNTAWSKLYRRNLVEGIRFKDGRNNEDTLYMFELSKLMEARGIGMLTVPHYLYFYRMREGSICNSTHKPLALDIMKNQQEMRKYFLERGDRRAHDAEIEYTRTLVYFCMDMIYNRHWKERHFGEYYPKMKTLDNALVKEAFASNKKMVWHFRMYKLMPKLYTLLKRIKGV